MDGIRHMRCDRCGYEWDALCYWETKLLECPHCGTMVPVAEAREDQENQCSK